MQIDSGIITLRLRNITENCRVKTYYKQAGTSFEIGSVSAVAMVDYVSIAQEFRVEANDGAWKDGVCHVDKVCDDNVDGSPTGVADRRARGELRQLRKHLFHHRGGAFSAKV